MASSSETSFGQQDAADAAAPLRGETGLALIASKLATEVDIGKLRTRPVGGGKQAVYMGQDVVLEQANSIFGFAWWSDEVKTQKIVHLTNDNGRWSCLYMVHMRVCFHHGHSGHMNWHEDIGFGSGLGPHINDVVEQAYKSAYTDARKRTLRLFGAALGSNINSEIVQNDAKEVQKAHAQYVSSAAAGSSSHGYHGHPGAGSSAGGGWNGGFNSATTATGAGAGAAGAGSAGPRPAAPGTQVAASIPTAGMNGGPRPHGQPGPAGQAGQGAPNGQGGVQMAGQGAGMPGAGGAAPQAVQQAQGGPQQAGPVQVHPAPMAPGPSAVVPGPRPIMQLSAASVQPGTMVQTAGGQPAMQPSAQAAGGMAMQQGPPTGQASGPPTGVPAVTGMYAGHARPPQFVQPMQNGMAGQPGGAPGNTMAVQMPGPRPHMNPQAGAAWQPSAAQGQAHGQAQGQGQGMQGGAMAGSKRPADAENIGPANAVRPKMDGPGQGGRPMGGPPMGQPPNGAGLQQHNGQSYNGNAGQYTQQMMGQRSQAGAMSNPPYNGSSVGANSVVSAGAASAGSAVSTAGR